MTAETPNINTTNPESSSECQNMTHIPQNTQSGTRHDFDFTRIPIEMQNCNRWVMWKLESRGDKPTKVPYQIDGKKAKTNDPATWSSFDRVVEAYQTGNFSGIGFCLGPDEEIGKTWLGFDVDKRRDPDSGAWDDDYDLALLLGVGSYAEISQSGTGGHAVAWGELKGDRRRKGSYEIYDGFNKEGDFAGRFFVVTGWKIDGSAAGICDADSDGIAAIERIIHDEKTPIPPKPTAASPITSAVGAPDKYANRPANDEIIAMIRRSKQAEKFRLLYDEGAWDQASDSGGKSYPSASEARFALISMVYWWTRDVVSTHAIVSKSAFARADSEKWIRVGGGEVRKAAAEFSESDDPPWVTRKTSNTSSHHLNAGMQTKTIPFLDGDLDLQITALGEGFRNDIISKGEIVVSELRDVPAFRDPRASGRLAQQINNILPKYTQKILKKDLDQAFSEMKRSLSAQSIMTETCATVIQQTLIVSRETTDPPIYHIEMVDGTVFTLPLQDFINYNPKTIKFQWAAKHGRNLKLKQQDFERVVDHWFSISQDVSPIGSASEWEPVADEIINRISVKTVSNENGVLLNKGLYQETNGPLWVSNGIIHEVTRDFGVNITDSRLTKYLEAEGYLVHKSKVHTVNGRKIRAWGFDPGLRDNPSSDSIDNTFDEPPERVEA